MREKQPAEASLSFSIAWHWRLIINFLHFLLFPWSPESKTMSSSFIPLNANVIRKEPGIHEAPSYITRDFPFGIWDIYLIPAALKADILVGLGEVYVTLFHISCYEDRHRQQQWQHTETEGNRTEWQNVYCNLATVYMSICSIYC